MKQIVLWMCLLLIIPTQGCRKLKSLANININIPYSTQVTLPAVYEDGLPLPFGGVNANVGPIGIATNSKEYLAKYNTNAENILHVKLTQLSLNVISPSGESLDFVDTVRIYISANGQPEVLAAYSYGRPSGDKMELTCADINLKEYFLQDMIYFKMNARFNRAPAPGTTVGIEMVFNMLANPLY